MITAVVAGARGEPAEPGGDHPEGVQRHRQLGGQVPLAAPLYVPLSLSGDRLGIYQSAFVFQAKHGFVSLLTVASKR